MRSEDEDEEDYDEDENIDEDEDGDQYGGHQMPPSEGVYDEEDQDGDADGDGDDDDAEGEGEEDDDDQQNDEDDDEDEQDQDGDEDDDEDGEGDDDDDEEGEDGDGEGEGHDDEEDADVELGATQDVQEVDGQDGDVDMEDKVGGRDTARKRSRSTTPINALSPSRRPPPPHLVRRAQLIPTYTSPPKSLSIDAIVAIPTPVPVHCLASTACSSYLLTGGQDGYVRAYDFYASVNGQQQLTAQQRVIIGMGETVSKMGVARGWWANEVGSDDEDDGEGDDGEADADGEGEMEVDGPVGGVPSSSSGAQKGKQGPDGKAKKKEKEPGDTKLESVYSMAVEGDGLWALTGSQSGPINMYTLRHDPGRLVHTLRGHRSVVSSMAVLPDEKGLMSGSWDGSIKQWDLNTGGIVRHYPTHGAQISSLSLQPTALFPYSSPSPRHRETMQSEMGEDKEDNEQADAAMADTVSVSVGPDFFKADRTSPLKGQNDAQQAESSAEANADSSDGKGHATRKDGDVDMDASPSKEAEKPTPKTSSPTKAASPIPSPKAAGSKRESREASFDDLFADDIADADGEADAEGEADADGEADAEGETVPPSEIGTGTNTPHASNGFGGLALPGLALPQPMASTSSASGSGAKSNIIGLNTSTAAAAAAAAPVRGAADALPLLSPATYRDFSEGVMLASFMDGQVMLIDRRVPEKEHAEGRGVGRFTPGEKAPPWCMSILAGRRNGTIDIWDVRKSSSSTAPNLLRTLRTPPESGPVSCVVPFPDGRHIATASQDNVRLWNTAEYFEESAEESIRRAKSKPPFKIIAGHHGGIVSSMIVDPTSRFLTVASGDRGWQGESTKVVLIHEIRW